MKLIYLMALLVLSSFLSYIAQGARFGKVALSASNHDQDILKISSVKESVQHDQLLAKSDIFSSGTNNRKLMTRISSLTSTNDSENQKNEHDPKPQVIKSTHQYLAGKKEETSSNSSLENSKHRVITEQFYSDVTDNNIAEMDYTPARKKSPIHN